MGRSFDDPPYNIISIIDQTGSRLIDGTVYTNTTGRTLFVYVTIQCVIGATPNVATCTFVAGAPSFTLGFVGTGNPIGAAQQMQGVFVVAPGATYRATANAGATSTVSLVKWIEAY